MKYKISAVSYLNTLPFLYGLQQSEYLKDKSEITVDYPARVADKLISGKADIGLVPVVILKDYPHLKIISKYGIVADGEVASVKLFSPQPVNNIDRILLDYQSRTSVNLVRILARYHWKINPQWIKTANGFEYDAASKDAAVIIGDRALRLLGKVKYEYDLAQEWKKMTGLPFVFAVWAANKPLETEFIRNFDLALQAGIENIPAVIDFFQDRTSKVRPFFDPYRYLSSCIKYPLTSQAYQAIEKFFYFLEQI